MSKTGYAVGAGRLQAVGVTLAWMRGLSWPQVAKHRLCWICRELVRCFPRNLAKRFKNQVGVGHKDLNLGSHPGVMFLHPYRIQCCVRRTERPLGSCTLVFHGRELFSSGAYGL